MISTTAEYALRATVWLGARRDAPQTAEQIAAATAVPSGYLAKVLRALVRGGIVASQPGPGGGCRLTRPPEEITVLEVCEAIEPFRRIEACPLRLAQHDGALCPLHARLDAAIALIQDSFRGCTIASLIGDGGARAPLCVEPKS